ncbi:MULTISPECIES: hypothetical protein [Rhizobium/Agrobacterium group]|nr:MULTISPECIES: hypothetical protein [Rhizobium/Agrobacterium group]
MALRSSISSKSAARHVPGCNALNHRMTLPLTTPGRLRHADVG